MRTLTVGSDQLTTVRNWLTKVGIDHATSNRVCEEITRFVEAVTTRIENVRIGIAGSKSNWGFQHLWWYVGCIDWDLEEPTHYPEMDLVNEAYQISLALVGSKRPSMILMWSSQENYENLEAHIRQVSEEQGHEFLAVFK